MDKTNDSSIPSNTVKVKFEVIDPVGIVADTFSFNYVPAYYAGRAVLTIGNHIYMVTGNGEYIYKISETIETEKKQACDSIGKKISEDLKADLQKLDGWLKSDEGKQILKEAMEKAEETNKIINKLRDIDPDKLREPFTI